MSARLAVTEQQPVRRFSWQWFLAALRTAGWVAVITVLIWVYADLQFTDERDIRATLRVHADSASSLVLLDPTGELTVNFRVKGYRYSIDSFQGRLANMDWKLHYDAARHLEPGKHPERIADLLADVAEIREARLTVLSATPRNIAIHLDELRRVKDVPVQFQATGGEALDVNVQPKRVDLLVPASQLGRIDPKLVLRTRPFDLGGLVVGRQVTDEPVAVLPPPDVRGVRLVNAIVRVSFKVGGLSSKEFTVRVDVNTPKTWLEDGTWDKYLLQAKPPERWTRRIQVLGSRIDLEQLGREDIKAYVELVDAAKDLASWEPGQIRVVLPPGPKLRLSPDPLPPLEYRLTKRTPAP